MSRRLTCCLCGGIPDKTAIGLNKKLLGKETDRFYCLSCFAINLEVTVEDLLEKAEDFKRQGCMFFQ